MTLKEDVTRELDAASALVEAVRRIVADGRAVDLAGLDSRIARLCRLAERLAPAEAMPFRARLIALLDDVDRLAGSLEAQRATIARELASVATRRRAATAYGRAAKNR
jgi:hypothetical protein